MVQVLRWYLSAFHAGRRSEVAKKPYNPIIGETFRCWWDIDDDNKQPATQSSVPDGPLPWCGSNQLTFIAEQVSHHPPGIYHWRKYFLNVMKLMIDSFFFLEWFHVDLLVDFSFWFLILFPFTWLVFKIYFWNGCFRQVVKTFDLLTLRLFRNFV